jgi:DNA polymerase (family 10)
VHSRFDLPQREQTERVLRAIRHPRVHLLAHPTGRKVERRKGIDLDLPRVLEAAREHRVAVECNASPDRLDLRDSHLAMAREMEVPVVISTDAHHPRELAFMRWGVDQARRARLEPRHVLNTRPLAELLDWLRR